MSRLNMQHLGQRLRNERIRLNWSQKRLADAIGTTSMSINRWEHGKVSPQPFYREQLCRIFNIPADALFTADNETENHSPAQSFFWFLPYHRNPFFTGREEVLLGLHDMLNTKKAVALTHAQAISGLGGIGKTQTAIEYAYRYRHDYSSILWVRAETRDVLLADLVSLAELLKLPEKNEQDQKIIAKAVKQWLENSSHWLLILDNVEDFAMLADVLPSQSNGCILLTTRVQAMGTLADRITLEQMEPNEGTLFLLRRAKSVERNVLLEEVPEAWRVQAGDISQTLDGLPLALDQAGAYIEETGCRLSDYLAYYHQYQAALLARRGSDALYHPDSVTTTFTLSFERVERISPAAADLLRLCAFFPADVIPEELLVAAGKSNTELETSLVSPLARHEAIALLRHYSLLHLHPDTTTLTIHRLVQVVLRETLTHHAQRQWAVRAVNAINTLFPDTNEDIYWSHCRFYLPLALWGSRLIERWEIQGVEAARLLNETGACMLEQANYTQAEVLFQKAYELRVQALGPHHLDVARTLNDLGTLYYARAQFEQAETFYQQAREVCEQVGGYTTQIYIHLLGNLAVLYKNQERYQEAQVLYAWVLARQETLLGEAHLDVALTLNNLGVLYRSQGDYEAAESLLLRALHLRERALGTEHPLVAVVLNNLGKLFLLMKQYISAEALLLRAIAIKEQAYGLDHPAVALGLHNLASLYQKQDQRIQAEGLLRRAFAIQERILGPQHPQTLQTSRSLKIVLMEIEVSHHTEPI